MHLKYHANYTVLEEQQKSKYEAKGYPHCSENKTPLLAHPDHLRETLQDGGSGVLEAVQTPLTRASPLSRSCVERRYRGRKPHFHYEAGAKTQSRTYTEWRGWPPSSPRVVATRHRTTTAALTGFHSNLETWPLREATISRETTEIIWLQRQRFCHTPGRVHLPGEDTHVHNCRTVPRPI